MNKPVRSILKARGFTLVEVMLAVVIAAFVLGSITMTLGQLARTKDISKTRLDAHLRADAALHALRSDIASVIRHDDLFWTRLLIRSQLVRTPVGDLYSDEILVFNNRLHTVHDLDFNGMGMQYETQYRIEADEQGSILWQRRDPVPDEHPLAGGIATPLVEGIVALRFEAYDGHEWHEEWDSDDSGLPLAVRITLIASGHRNGDDLWTAPLVHLRTVVPIDRVLPPSDLFRIADEEEEEEELEDVSDGPTVSRPDARDRGGREGRDIRGPREGGIGDGTEPRRPDLQPGVGDGAQPGRGPAVRERQRGGAGGTGRSGGAGSLRGGSLR